MEVRRSDEALMLRYGEGDAHAFAQLYDRHKGGIYRYFRRQLSDPGRAEELFQDLWLRIVKSRERYEPKAKFSTFLYQVAHNLLVDHYRRQGRSAETTVDPGESGAEIEIPASPDYGPQAQLHQERLAQALKAALDALPCAQREAFLLHEEGGLSLDEIARVTAVGRETVKSRLRYATGKLRAQLEPVKEFE